MNYDLDSYNIPEILDDSTLAINNKPTYRQKRLRKNNEDVNTYKKVGHEEPHKRNNEESENINNSNTNVVRSRVPKIMED